LSGFPLSVLAKIAATVTSFRCAFIGPVNYKSLRQYNICFSKRFEYVLYSFQCFVPIYGCGTELSSVTNITDIHPNKDSGLVQVIADD
jgi:hypothetical protein